LVVVTSFQHNGAKLYAAYAHLSKALAKVGDKLSVGTVIAKTGESGNARGMASPDQHLHFEIRTVPRPGVGLSGRKSPLEVFERCPLTAPIKRAGA
jgi:murein DD-endopeptidase MepM/ murein hydrolase activator NlpD